MKKYNLKILSIFLIIITCIFTTNISFADLNNNIKITAHRGSATFYPENTLLSISEAINENADYVEIDVRTTKDNYVVLFHDDNLKRIANSEKEIKDMTLEELKEIDVGSYKDRLFKGEKIPTLEEVFEKYKGKVKFNIELKVKSNNDLLPEEVAKLIDKYNMNHDVIITSFNKGIIEKYKNDNPHSKTGIIASRITDDLYKANSDIISLRKDLISKEVVDEFNNNNKEVYVWTVNYIDKISEVVDLGVDNIITDNVTLVQGIWRYKLENS